MDVEGQEKRTEMEMLLIRFCVNVYVGCDVPIYVFILCIIYLFTLQESMLHKKAIPLTFG